MLLAVTKALFTLAIVSVKESIALTSTLDIMSLILPSKPCSALYALSSSRDNLVSKDESAFSRATTSEEISVERL